MTDPKVLADALVKAGIVEEIDGGFYVPAYSDAPHPKQFICDAGPLRVYDEHLITDWRVAGKCLESMGKSGALMARVCVFDADGEYTDVGWLTDPRAIIEAWYESR